MVTAKVVCRTKDVYKDSDGKVQHSNVYFTADYVGGRNKDWAEATPYLSLHMKLNAEATKLYEEGKRYTLQFVEDDSADAQPDSQQP